MLNTSIYQQRESISFYLNSLWFTTSSLTDLQKDSVLTSFVHKSYASDFVPPLNHNERCEFLGDGILWGAVAFLLYQWYPQRSEAQMTLYKIALVREEMLAQVAREIGLGSYLFISHGEERQQWRDKDVILADTLEALIGVWYEIHGFASVQQFIQKYIFIHLEELVQTNCKSYKSLLQEWAQKNSYLIPDYIMEEKKQIWSSDTIFIANVTITDFVYGTGQGRNKKKAQEAAAKDAYTKITTL
jgi:ribonuclease-3